MKHIKRFVHFSSIFCTESDLFQARQQFYGPPMRKIDEERDRTHAFGNPYKLKGMGAGIDEVLIIEKLYNSFSKYFRKDVLEKDNKCKLMNYVF